MKRINSLLLVAVVACGGSKTAPSTTPLPPEPTPEPTAAEKPAPPPPAPAPTPLDLPIPVVATTLKLVKPGTGKKAVLKLAATQGAKQHVELALDFAGKQTASPELGGTQEDMAPTLVLASDVEVGQVTADGHAAFKLTVGGIDAKDRPGAKSTAAQFKDQMAGIAGLTIAGSVGANGQLGELSIHLDKADKQALNAVALLKLSMMPMWPQLPTDPIGVGAKWTVTGPYKIADRLDTQQTIEFELVSHKGNAWEIKGTVKVAGADQKVDPQTTLEKIGGTGAIAMTLTDDTFVPASSSTLASDFTATAQPPPSAGSAAAPQSAQFHLEQGFAVTPK